MRARDARTLGLFGEVVQRSSNTSVLDALRWYQQDAHAAINEAFARGVRSTLLVLATGMGKTETFTAVVKTWPGRVLVLAHREELIEQARKRIERNTGEYVEVEQGQLRSGRARIVVGSVQTVYRPERLERLTRLGGFTLIVVDECFPAGTLVDGKRIEEYKPGDMVWSVNHASGRLVRSRVVSVSKRATRKEMVRLTIGESAVVCTPNHPFFVRGRGYVHACNIRPGDVCCLRRSLSSEEKDVLEDVQVLDLLGSYGAHKPEVRLRANEGEEPDALCGVQGEGECDAQGHRSQAVGAGWKRERPYGGGAVSCVCVGRRVDDGGCDCDKRYDRGEASESLQAGRLEHVSEGDNRSGRAKSLDHKGKGGGRKKRDGLAWCRVDCFSRVELGGNGECAVYNLHVEGTNSYFANGILVHNCHHYVSPTYRLPLEHFSEAKVLGVTATPDRADAKALGQIFDEVAYTMDLQEGIGHGYLVPLRGRSIEVEEINLDGVATVAGDLAVGQLDETMLEGVEGIVKGMVHRSGTRQGIVFFPGVASARLAAERFNALRPGSAMSVDGETPKEQRAELMDGFRRGEFQFLTNCMVATEGFDAPSASVVGIARPTKSRALYAQMVGRGTRVLPNVVDHIKGRDEGEQRRAAIAASAKPGCLLLDFVGNSTRHTLITPMDLLGGNYDAPVRKRAREIANEADGEMDVQEALEEAKNDLDRKELKRIAKGITSKVKAKSQEFDPFRHFGLDKEAERKYDLEYGYKPPTDRQKAFLLRHGFSPKELDGVSSKTASKMIQQLMERTKKGLATKPQADALSRAGIVDPAITAKAAAGAMSYIMKQRSLGQPADPAVIRILTSTEEF